MNNSKKFSLPSANIEVELGKFAQQANGSVCIRSGGTMVLSAACASGEPKDFPGFFPLTVEHRERPASVGKFPGGFVKREGKLAEAEVLLSRVIDRSIRPLFPEHFFNEVQLTSTLLSSDLSYPTDVLAVIGASLALTISDIPFLEPIAAVHAYRIDGKWVFNVNAETAKNADCSWVIAGTQGGICMVEGYANNLSSDEAITVLNTAHDKIKEITAWQTSIAAELGKTKMPVSAKIDWARWEKEAAQAVDMAAVERLVGAGAKDDFSQSLEACKEASYAKVVHFVEAGEITASIMKYLLDSIIKEALPKFIYQKKSRFDGRSFDTVRPITCEVGLLPATHGSALFQRGETQALGTVVLGTGQDAQRLESLAYGPMEQLFMLHYNFPPYSVGEVRMIRAVSRREIGHGHLAEISFKHVLPDEKKFPYTIRSLVDVLSSNGSSSMAAVCVSSLALMDAGVPLTDAVAGVAMGLVSGGPGQFEVLTDILGAEDAFGLMDLKITGTRKGITGIQMDVKHKLGLSQDVLKDAFARAENARIHILDIMSKVITSSRTQLAAHAPQLVSFSIPPAKIGAVIGTGGKIIKEIMATTSVEIDIADDGLVKIYGRSAESTDKAVQWVKAIVGDLEIGASFVGTIRKIADFGIFVEIVPGCDGLIHISAIARNKQPDVVKKYKPNDKITVTVLSYDAASGRVRLSAPELE